MHAQLIVACPDRDDVAEASNTVAALSESHTARAIVLVPGACLTGTDYLDYIDVVYILTSMKHNHSVVLKTRCNREKPEVPSVVELWRGADYQEREVYDLLGVKFAGHPNMKRLFLWEGFKGHPLRRHYL